MDWGKGIWSEYFHQSALARSTISLSIVVFGGDQQMTQLGSNSTKNYTNRRGWSCLCDLIGPSIRVPRISLRLYRSPQGPFRVQ